MSVDITGFQRQRREAAARLAELSAEEAENDEQSGAEHLDEAALAEMMRNKTNVMSALKHHGAEFSDRASADDLREQLTEALKSKGLLSNDGR